MPEEKTSTRNKIILSACNLFTTKGFRAVSVAEICDDAGTNIASVNYHFGGKDALYRDVWHHAAEAANSSWPVLKNSGSAEERLHFFVSNMLKRIFDPGAAGAFPRLIIRELADPTPALKEIAKNIISPVTDYLREIIEEILGPKADLIIVRNHIHSIVGQYTFYAFSRPIMKIKEEQEDFPPLCPEEIAEHIVSNALTGLTETRRKLES